MTEPVALRAGSKRPSPFFMRVIPEARHRMLEHELVELVKSSLEKPVAERTAEDLRAGMELCELCAPIIRGRVWCVPLARPDADDIAQDVWLHVIRELPRWEFDPPIGTFHA
jgi:hypothetical protein